MDLESEVVMDTDTKRIRVFLIDDHELVRAAMRMLVESRELFAVVGESTVNGTLPDSAARQKPDIILVDLDDENSVALIPELLEAANPAQIIVLTEGYHTDIQHKAVHLGAQGIVLKDQPPGMLLNAIEKVYEGEVWLNRTMMATVLNRMRQSRQELSPEETRIATLTEREHEVIMLIGDGLRNQDISERLHISESTVGHHLSSIYSKLSVSDRLELLIFAYRHRLVELPR